MTSPSETVTIDGRFSAPLAAFCNQFRCRPICRAICALDSPANTPAWIRIRSSNVKSVPLELGAGFTPPRFRSQPRAVPCDTPAATAASSTPTPKDR